jgi:hypothetical protein
VHYQTTPHYLPVHTQRHQYTHTQLGISRYLTHSLSLSLSFFHGYPSLPHHLTSKPPSFPLPLLSLPSFSRCPLFLFDHISTRLWSRVCVHTPADIVASWPFFVLATSFTVITIVVQTVIDQVSTFHCPLTLTYCRQHIRRTFILFIQSFHSFTHAITSRIHSRRVSRFLLLLTFFTPLEFNEPHSFDSLLRPYRFIRSAGH